MRTKHWVDTLDSLVGRTAQSLFVLFCWVKCSLCSAVYSREVRCRSPKWTWLRVPPLPVEYRVRHNRPLLYQTYVHPFLLFLPSLRFTPVEWFSRYISNSVNHNLESLFCRLPRAASADMCSNCNCCHRIDNIIYPGWTPVRLEVKIPFGR